MNIYIVAIRIVAYKEILIFSSAKKRIRVDSDIDPSMQEIADALARPVTVNMPPTDSLTDSLRHFSGMIAAELKQFPVRERNEAMRRMFDVLFEIKERIESNAT